MCLDKLKTCLSCQSSESFSFWVGHCNDTPAAWKHTHTMLYQHSGNKQVTSTFPFTGDLPGNTRTHRLLGATLKIYVFFSPVALSLNSGLRNRQYMLSVFLFCKSEGHKMITLNLFCLLFKVRLVRKNYFPKRNQAILFC